MMSPKQVLNILECVFPNAQSELNHRNPFELLVAVILSAQATDVSVNKVTPKLFSRFPNAFALAKSTPQEVEPYIKTIGLYRNKARFLVEASQVLVQKFAGEVPKSREELMTLPGVGRKTANVVLYVGFDIPAIAVDTHVDRVAKRLGWADPTDTVFEVEQKLMNLLDKSDWGKAHHLLLLFGRYYSTARNNQDIYELLSELKTRYDNENDEH